MRETGVERTSADGLQGSPGLLDPSGPSGAHGLGPHGLHGLDRLATALAARLHRLALPLARAGEAFAGGRGWFDLGFARAEDFARERLGRSGRWLRDRAALGRAVRRCRRLRLALDGADGGPPLGTVAAVLIARHADLDSTPTWIGIARASGVRRLKERIRESRACQVAWPVLPDGSPDEELRPPDELVEWAAEACPQILAGPAFAEALKRSWNRRFVESRGLPMFDPGVPAEVPDASPDRMMHREPFPVSPAEDGPDSDRHEPRATIRLVLPAPVVAAFHEVRQLHRCVCGTRDTLGGFTAALVAEARAAGLDPHPDLDGALELLCRVDRADPAEREAEWDRRRGSPPAPSDPPSAAFLPSECSPPDTESADVVRRAEALLARAGDLFARAGEGDAAQLARQLGELVAIEEEIRRSLGDLLAIMARSRAWPVLGFDSIRHYAEVRLGMSRSVAEDLATLARGLAPLSILDEARAAGRLSSLAALRVLRILGRGPAPGELQQAWLLRAESATIKRLDDELHAIRQRRLAESGPSARDVHPLSDAAWHRSLERPPGATTARIRALSRLADDRGGQVAVLRLDLSFGIAADFLGALEAAARRVRMFSADLAPFDARWLGLYTLLTTYAATHDAHRGPPGVYARDGWRCMAPGCTSSSRLEDHHVLYRARGGDDEPDNRVTLCRFHHQRGEHGGGMQVRGRAPLRLDFELGGLRYRNERVVARPGASRAAAGQTQLPC
ncbi:MAG: HNH endonuclease [Acidobacteria bacterium]|jgi:hypothetical protein|nr:HNH endonuclease [Acidobacteriota bacterium]